MDHENQELSPTVSQSGEPQEVVLRYEAPVTPIVERYVQPTPLPGQPKKHTSPRKKRKGLKIFLFCMLGLLLVSGVVTALWLGGAFDDHRSYHDDDFEQRHDEDYYDNSEHGETTIKRLPNTDKVKLRYNESHGEKAHKVAPDGGLLLGTAAEHPGQLLETPAAEDRLPEVGGNFVQGESEVASINMVYGSASVGARSMTSSSSPGIALKSEGISYCAAARIPIVYANISRGGPGVGAIQPAQQDYFQATKASGNGGFEMIVLAPATVQEAVDLTYKAFDLADRDRNPVLILADGVIGTMMEPVELPEMKSDEEIAAIRESKKKWACIGHELDLPNRSWIEPGQWDTNKMQRVNEEAAALYASWEKDVMVEEYCTEDAEVVITAYGISGRIAKSVVEMMRAEGKKVGLIRPITVHPFPKAAFDKLDYGTCHAILDVEMSIPAQMVEDVDHAVRGRCPIKTCLCSGGNVMSREAVVEAVEKLLNK